MPLSGIKVTYRIGPEMMPPKIDQTATLTDDGLTVEGGTMNEPGFLRCIATVEQNGKTYRGLATAAFRPEAIKPTQQEPADFDQFWASGKAALAKLPIDAKITPLPEYGNASADCYQVNLQNVGMGAAPSRFYGVLCEPKAPGKYPALLSVPGAGVRPYRGLAEMAGARHHHPAGGDSRHPGDHGTVRIRLPRRRRPRELQHHSDSTTAIVTITGVSISAASAPTTF